MSQKNPAFKSKLSLVQAAYFWNLTLLVLLTFIVGCQSQKDAAKKTSPGQTTTIEPLLIGFSLADLKEERWQRDRDYFVAKAESLGAKVIVQDAGGDPNAQARQCEGLLAKGVKVLVVVPKNADAARPIVLNAHAKHVKVISYDRLIADAAVDLYLSFDNEKVGEIQAQALVSKTPKGNFLILRGDPADKNSDMVHAGHMKVLQPYLDKGDIKIVANQACDKWLRSEARRITADALQKYKVDAVLASNDGTASGAISALEDKKLAGQVPVSGQDADLIACQYIWKGIQTVTVYKPIRALAEYAATAAVLAAKMAVEAAKMAVEAANLSDTLSQARFFDSTAVNIANGSFQVPAVFLTPIPVTKENLMETVVADGYHTREEITGPVAAGP